MRYPEEHKAQVRARIVAAAAKMLRERGLSAVSIPELMKQVGLTHGGFYSHFQDRDELVAEAIIAAAHETGGGVFGEGHSLEAALSHYLSLGHVERPSGGCVVAALGTEAHGQSERVRGAFSEAARGLISLVQQKLLPQQTKKPTTKEVLQPEALRLTSQMLGAVILSRLVDDKDLAEKILEAAKATPKKP
jgi:TetR/AcrR family transcriptional repressor of nem operon